MAEKNNFYKITGIVYEKPVRTVVSKKKATAGQSFDFPSLVLEVKAEFKGKTYSDLIEFEPAGRNVAFDGFEVNDKVEIAFALGGKEETYTRDGAKEKRIRNRIKAIGIRHTDIQGNDMKDLSRDRKDDYIPPPSPFDDKDSENDNLPF